MSATNTPDVGRILAKWLHDKPKVKRHALWWKTKLEFFFERRFPAAHRDLRKSWEEEAFSKKDFRFVNTYIAMLKVRYIFLWLWQQDLLVEWHRSHYYASLELYAVDWVDYGTDIRAHQRYIDKDHVISLSWINRGGDPYKDVNWTDAPFPPRGSYFHWFQRKMERFGGFRENYDKNNKQRPVHGISDYQYPYEHTMTGYRWGPKLVIVFVEHFNHWADSKGKQHIKIGDLPVAQKKDEFLAQYDAWLVSMLGEGVWTEQQIDEWLKPLERWTDQQMTRRENRRSGLLKFLDSRPPK